MNIGEGAAILVLEEMARARRARGDDLRRAGGVELLLRSVSSDGAGAGRQTGHRRRARCARRRGHFDRMQVEHINAHGTATPQNDRAETRGYRALFGDRVNRIPVTSIKSMLGHCLGAAGGIEVAVLALTVARGVIPPTVHHGQTDPECSGDIVANDARETRITCGVSTSLGFGGNDSAVVITAV